MVDSLFILNFSKLTNSLESVFKVIKRILLFTSLIIVLDILVGNGLEFLYFKQKYGLYARTTYGLEQTEADLLIFGSSSANHHYIPTIFEETLNVTAYNEGRDGIDILYQAAILKGIFKRYTPKIIILNLSPYELSTERGYDRLSALLPYCKKYPEMKRTIFLRSKFEKWKLLSKIYPFNSTFLTLLNGIHKVVGNKAQDNGYLPLIGSLDTNKFRRQTLDVQSQIDPNRVKALIDFINQCKQRKVLVYIFFSPVYDFGSHETLTIKEAMRISEAMKIPQINFINDPNFKGQALIFKDNGHMNHDGAIKFSKILAAYIKENLHRKKLKI